MTPEEIRAESIERIARASYHNQFSAEGYVWEETTATIRDRFRCRAATAVDALGGLLPTEMEIEPGLMGQRGDGSTFRYTDDEVRFVTPWRKATPSTQFTKDRT